MTGALTVRVWVPDVWDHLDVSVTPDDTFADVKAGVLARAIGRSADPAEYEVKYRGALVTNEGQTLGGASVPNRAPMIVLPSHRRPVS